MKQHVMTPDLHGRRPVQCRLALGKKGPTGAPTEVDRWHITDTVMESRKANGRRGEYTIEEHPPHPAFREWYASRDRATLRVQLEHLSWGENVTHGMRRMVDRNGNQPKGTTLPWCYTVAPGMAMRWNDAKGHHQQHRCLGYACPEAQQMGREGKPSPWNCRPSMTLHGRLVWDGTPWAGRLPELSFVWQSGAWSSSRGILGVEEELDTLWRALVVRTSGASELADRPLAEVLELTGAPPYMVAGLQLDLRVIRQRRNGNLFTQVDAHPVQPLSDWLNDHARRVAEMRGIMDGARLELEHHERRAIAGPAAYAVEEVEAEPIDPPERDETRTEKAIAWWASRGVDVAQLVAWTGAQPDAWTAEHFADLQDRAKTWGKA